MEGRTGNTPLLGQLVCSLPRSWCRGGLASPADSVTLLIRQHLWASRFLVAFLDRKPALNEGQLLSSGPGQCFPKGWSIPGLVTMHCIDSFKEFLFGFVGAECWFDLHIHLCVKMRQDYFCAKERPVIAGDKRTNILTV